jgi:hypothetical protein
LAASPTESRRLRATLDGRGLVAPHPRCADQPREHILLVVLLEEGQQVLERGEARESAHELEGAPDAEPRDAVGRHARHVMAVERPDRRRNGDSSGAGSPPS